MTTAPAFLARCPTCLGLHPWREAARSALPIERVEPHLCQHGNPCGPQTCAHGRFYGDVRAEPSGDGSTVLACACVGPRPCKGCTQLRADAAKLRGVQNASSPGAAVESRLRAMGTCVVCREVERQVDGKKPAGGWCVSLFRKAGKSSPKYSETLVESPPRGCPYKTGERPPPWCAGATDEEKQRFLMAFPDAMRDGALAEARKANKQEGAAQRTESPKVVKQKKEDRQTKLF